VEDPGAWEERCPSAVAVVEVVPILAGADPSNLRRAAYLPCLVAEASIRVAEAYPGDHPGSPYASQADQSSAASAVCRAVPPSRRVEVAEAVSGGDVIRVVRVVTEASLLAVVPAVAAFPVALAPHPAAGESRSAVRQEPEPAGRPQTAGGADPPAIMDSAPPTIVPPQSHDARPSRPS